MKSLKKLLLPLLALALLCPTAVQVRAADFSDVPAEHWAEHNIDWCSRYGLMQGVGEGRFGLGEKMSRASYVMTLCRLMGWPTQGGETGSFEDNQDPQKWYYGAIEEAFARGVLTRQSTLCRPDEPITREEMAVMTVRALGYTTLAGIVAGEECPFADVSANQGYITLAYRMGFTNGTGRFTFTPGATATREEAATILLRVYNRIHNGISLNYGEVPEGVAEVESYEGMQSFPMSPRAPMEALYRLALTGVTSVYIDGGAWAQNVKNGEVGEGRYLTGAELQDCLVRGKMYRSTRYESSYITCPEEDGSTTVVWFESEGDIQKKVQLCRCLGIAELYVKR
ncbi:MAG: S-layer homology domain-containing protein [Oscillospiraceae bacterium]|nr:S-layer homology domain-containing protein [Oscillospiraceae bacterium]